MHPVSSRPAARFGIRFDDLAFQEELGRATKRGREVASEARDQLERDGADPSELLRCQTEYRHGTELSNCVKVYLPPPDGCWGMVLELVRERSSGKLAYLAFGERHPDPRRGPDVCRRAHERLNPLVLAWPALILPLGLDTFAVSAVLGIGGLPKRDRLRVALLFTAFEACMPLIGLAIGAPLGSAIGGAADYVAVALLVTLGAYTLVSDEADAERVTRLGSGWGPGALILGLSVSLDELAIGFALGLLRLPTIPVVIVIAVQAFVAAQVGLRMGARASERIRQGTEHVAGIALFAVAIALLAQKLVS
jgi:putative Mn2+ efflux pump MntP